MAASELNINLEAVLPGGKEGDAAADPTQTMMTKTKFIELEMTRIKDQ